MDESFRNLKLLFNTMCLRRTETLLDLPPSTTETVLISRSPEKTAAYEAILDDCRAEYERQACGKSELKSFNILFQTAQKLRMLCNHGTFVTSNQHQRPRNRSKLRELEVTGGDSCVLCCMDENFSLSLSGAKQCPLCGQLLVTSKSQPSLATKNSLLSVSVTSSGASTPVSGSPSPARSPTSSTTGYSSKLLTVARVLRMGQTRPVKILRYVTEGTIEPVRFLVAD